MGPMSGGNPGERDNGLPGLYGELASWFHLLTAPEDYAEEAEFYRRTLVGACTPPGRTRLELGGGAVTMPRTSRPISRLPWWTLPIVCWP